MGEYEKKKEKVRYFSVTHRLMVFDFLSLGYAGTGSHRRSLTYNGKEDYLNQVTYLVGSQSSTVPIEMSAGVTSYNFACMLPPNLPSSVEVGRS